MREREEGHVYDLVEVVEEGAEIFPQSISFMKRIDGKMIHSGTTNEEVLRMLIARMKYLQGKISCRENAIVITKLEEALMWLDQRTKLRQKQNVETLDKPHQS